MKISAALFKTVLNLWPCIRGTGARVVELSDDFHFLRVEIPLSWRTRNRVGTIFGGSMYGAVDPFAMIMLMEILGRGYVVWDKGAEIKFKKPGKTTLHADFEISDDLITQIQRETAIQGSYVFDMIVPIVDADNVVHAEVKKILYVATKEHYKKKMKND